MNIFKEIINLYKDYLQKEKAMAKAYEEITEKMEDGITLADQIIDVLKENKILKEQNKILEKKLHLLRFRLNSKPKEPVMICIDEFDTSVKLAEAKRIILNIVSLFNIKNSSPDQFYKIIKEAEQFLKENE